MSTAATEFPLQKAHGQVLQWMHKAGIDGYINKIDTARHGKLYFELVLSGKRRWLRWEDGRLKELDAAKDQKIPLAEMLRDPTFEASAKLLSYRPKRRLTLLDGSHHKPRILKGFRDGHLDQMIAHYETAHCAFSGRGVSTPDVFEYERNNQCLVMAHQPGERLRLSADTTDLFHLVGEALHGFQEYRPAAGDTVFSSRDELNVIDKRARRLERAAGSLPDSWPALRRRLEAAHETIPDAVNGLAHRDLHDKQFIQQVNFLTLLDFDLMCTADVTLDPANFLAHLVLRQLQGVQGATQRSIDACGKNFLQGLGRNAERGFWHRLRFYQATSFCRLALVYVLRPRWEHLVPDLVTMGNRCLDDLQRIGEQ